MPPSLRLVESNDHEAANPNTEGQLAAIAQAINSHIDNFKAAGVTVDYSQIQRHGIRLGDPDQYGNRTDYVYIPTPPGNTYHVEQNHFPDETKRTVVSQITPDGHFFPPRGIVVEDRPDDQRPKISTETISLEALSQFCNDLRF
jgi:hypothetical protein